MSTLYKYSTEELKQFWAGLMEGDGSFQVNHWRGKSLQLRLTIKLKHTEANKKMLEVLATLMGASYREPESNVELKIDGVKTLTRVKWAQWVMNDSSRIAKTLEVFKTYPPLTSKATCGVQFMLNCLENPDIDWYFANRELKYSRQSAIIDQREQKFEIPSYWGPWLAGFTEAEGCFSIKESGSHSFSISQNNDAYLLKAIRQFFGINAKVLEQKKLKFLETTAKATLELIISFYNENYLLGEKGVSFERFKVAVLPQIQQFYTHLAQREINKNK